MKLEHPLLAAAKVLGNDALLARLESLAKNERSATAELVGHLAELDTRPRLYAERGHASLFAYCTVALRLSEDAAYNRIEAARTARRFPAILDRLADGDLSLTAARMLARHLTPDNHAAVLDEARNKSKRDVERIVAQLAPRADAAAMIRRLAEPAGEATAVTPDATDASAACHRASRPGLGISASPPPPQPVPVTTAVSFAPARSASRPDTRASSPNRYRVQFTIGQDTHDKLRRLQDLLAGEVPTGDPAALFDRAITVLLARVEKRKGIGRLTATRRARSGTTSAPPSRTTTRNVPVAVRRLVWQRDDGRCAYVSPGDGRRCTERRHLEFHHRRPYALGGPHSPANIALRCRTHNRLEAEQVFGPRAMSRPGRGVAPELAT